MNDLSARRVLIVVSGGVAAYKTVDVVRRLLKRGADVRAVMTRSATRFVHPTTFAAITGARVGLDMFTETGEPWVDHLEMPHWAELIIVAPATANLLAKMAHGIADDLASTALLAATCPVLFAPAMNPTMYGHPATQNNLNILRERGLRQIGPNTGDMAAPGEQGGEGRMSEPHEIEDEAVRMLTVDRPLSGKTVLITAGGTEEPIDRVRVLTNRSSGRMGVALADQARRLGAQVILVHARMDIKPPDGIKAVHTPTAVEMLDAVKQYAADADVALYVAAVSDWRPAKVHDGKFKRTEQQDETFTVEFVENPDISAETAPLVQGVAIGFALEVDDALDNARNKLERKKLDAILFNREENLGALEGALTWVDRSETSDLGRGTKNELATRVFERIIHMLDENQKSETE